MRARRWTIELSDTAAIDAQRDHLERGSVLAVGVVDVALGEHCEIELVNPAGRAIVMSAQAVWLGPDATAFAFLDSSPVALEAVGAWANEVVALDSGAHGTSPGDVSSGDGAFDGELELADETVRSDVPAELARWRGGEPMPRDVQRDPANLHERMRGLTLVAQLKVARSGELSERVVLERLYGKAVWEALLRNPRLSPPEVAHIARMGALPRPLIELIAGNAAWLQSPQVRRALLVHPRLGPSEVERILRATPRNELKMIAAQAIYPYGVRASAKRLIAGDVG